MAKKFGGIPPFEFLNFLKSTFPDIEKHFYVDSHQAWYHKGINNISSNIEETITYLRNDIRPFEDVVFIGVSAGGYAALLFGSILQVQTIICFVPQTKLDESHNLNAKYLDVKPYLNDKTNYYVYGNSKSRDELHSFLHCRHLEGRSNVHVYDIPNMSLPKMRDDGTLFRILEEHVTNKIIDI
jgi:hypothetical protein